MHTLDNKPTFLGFISAWAYQPDRGIVLSFDLSANNYFGDNTS